MEEPTHPLPAIMHGQPEANGEVFAVTNRATFDLTTERGRAELLEIIEAPALAADENLNVDIDVVGYVCHPAERIDQETGEVSHFTRTVLLLADGRKIGMGSDFARRSLDRMAFVRGHAPWNPPLKCRIVPERSSNKRTYYRIAAVVQ